MRNDRHKSSSQKIRGNGNTASQQSDSVSRVCKHIKDIMMYAGLPVISQDMDSGGRFWNWLKS